MSTPLTDADKVLRNDTGKDIVDKLDDIATAIAQGGGGGGASTVSQLTDVLLSATIPDGDVLIRDNNLTGGKLWKNKTITVELTQAEYDQLVADDGVLPDVNYYITDAPSMQGTSADLSYDGTTKSVYTKIGETDSAINTLTQKLNGLIVTVGTAGQYATFSALGQAISSGQACFCFYVSPTDLPNGWLNYGFGIAGKWGSIGTRLLVLGIKTDGSAEMQSFV